MPSDEKVSANLVPAGAPAHPYVPSDWHPAYWKGMPSAPTICPVCGCPREFLPGAVSLHRLAENDKTPAVKWIVRVRRHFERWIGADGTTFKHEGEPTEEMKRRLEQAATRLPFGVPLHAVAGLLGIKPDALRRCINAYKRFYDEEVNRALQQGPQALQTPVVPERAERIPKWILKKLPRVVAAIAMGKSHEEAARELDLLSTTIKDWQVRYGKLWSEAMNQAMEISTRAVRQLAGNAEILGDPDAYLDHARLYERWTRAKGESLLPKRDATLSHFYATYFTTVCLGETGQKSLRDYEQCVRDWVLVTNDPPLEEISTLTLSQYKKCLQHRRGKDPGSLMASATVRKHLLHIQTILSKAGPPGPRNRDAAGILAAVPWIRPPRVDLAFPKIVPLELLASVYLAAAKMEYPSFPGIDAPTWWRSLLAVTFNTGLRRRTLFELHMDDIEWQQSQILVPPRRIKSQRPTIVSLNAVAFEHLHAMRTDREMIFPWPCVDLTGFHRRFHELQDVAGVPPASQFGLHNIRKTMASILWEESPQAAQFALGHARMGVTKANYVNGQAMVARALARLPQPDAFRSPGKLVG
ncbi:MAG: tyrosine-type recombinase/integrase [Thermoguttaceae bacterium]